MSTDLSTLVKSLKRVLAVPGTFDDFFPDTSKSDLVGTLQDGFAEAQMDSLLTGMVMDDAGLVDTTMTQAEKALVVLYANARVLTSEIRNRKTHVKYQSGDNLFEEDQASSLLVEQLKVLQATKKQILANQQAGAGNLFYMVDAAWYRNCVVQPYGGAW